MKKQLVIIGIVTLLVCVGLSGCDQISKTLNTEKDKFVGTWLNSQKHNDSFGGGLSWVNTTMIFFSDGTMSSYTTFLPASGTWELKDGKLVMNMQMGDLDYTVVDNFSFSDNNKTLTLTSVSDGSSTVYTKK